MLPNETRTTVVRRNYEGVTFLAFFGFEIRDFPENKPVYSHVIHNLETMIQRRVIWPSHKSRFAQRIALSNWINS